MTTRRYTVDRRSMRALEDDAHATVLANWLSRALHRTDLTCDNMCVQLGDGVLLCESISSFGQSVQWHSNPKNEFQRRENLVMFQKACNRLGLTCAPPGGGNRGFEFREVLPCLMELANLAKCHEKALRYVIESMPEDLKARIESEYAVIPGGSGFRPVATTLEDFCLDEQAEDGKVVVLEGVSVVLPTNKAIRKIVLWQGAQVLLRDILLHQKKKFQDGSHRVLCLGLGTALCGMWTALTGSDVVLTDFRGGSIEVIWSTVFLNSAAIRAAGGMCGVRALNMKNFETDIEVTMKEIETEGELTVLASDLCFDAESLGKLISAVCSVSRSGSIRFYIVCHHVHVLKALFNSTTYPAVSFSQIFGDLEYRIFRGDVAKIVGE